MNSGFTYESMRYWGVSMLPVTAGNSVEGYRRPLGDKMNHFLATALPEVKVLTWQSSMDSINKASLVQSYEQLIGGYERTAILDKARTKELATCLGVRYALFCSIGDVSSGQTIVCGAGGAIAAKQTGNVEMICRIVDLENGDVMQEIFGQVSAQEATYGSNGKMPTYDAYADEIARAVVGQIPGAQVPAAIR